jgi:hypothetical protein
LVSAHDEPISNFLFNVNMRRYTKDIAAKAATADKERAAAAKAAKSAVMKSQDDAAEVGADG